MENSGRRHWRWPLVFCALVGVVAAFPQAIPAQQKPVEVIETGEAATLDWQMHCDKNAHEIDRQIFDTLLQRDPKTLQLHGNLAESWRLLNETTWQFKLRRGVRFHNGEPFDAAAVKANIGTRVDPRVPAQGGSAFADIVPGRIETPDPHTVVLHLARPDPMLLPPLASASGVKSWL